MPENNSNNKKIKVAVGMSGGVDSSVSAYLLKKQGYDVTGVYMQCWESKADGCRADADRADAVLVASKLGIKFLNLDFIKEYKEKVIEYFFQEYEAGRTPNPDVMCNKEIKFGMFLNWAMENGFDMVATGHYARVSKDGDQYVLKKGIDDSKDQSYFLYLLDQEQLSKIIFPVGGMLKTDLRALAEDVGISTYDKPDSVGICFIGEVNIREFLKKKLPEKPGKVVNAVGDVLGTHDGVHFYTIGQRHGFNIDRYVGLPLYVIGKNTENNELIVGFAKDVNKNHFYVDTLHWVSSDPGNLFEADVRIRHLGELHKCKVKVENGRAEVLVEDSIFGVAPGQSAVFYNEDDVLGGGIISAE